MAPVEIAILALATFLTIAAVQDIKTREIDWKILLTLAPPAAYLLYAHWGDPLYFFSLALSVLLSIVLRLLGSGYADSIAIATVGTAPPLSPLLLTPMVVVVGGSMLLPVTMTWLYLKNRKRPCPMSLLEKLTHICISREEFVKNPLKYIVGEVKDLEKYNPRNVEIRESWIKAKYGVPYLVYLAAGFWVYVALLLIM
ncbi:MAG: prepilin peptidase [Pyrobaculum sp.]